MTKEDGFSQYFAYGSNMDPERMSDRGVVAANAQKAWLRGYRFAFNKSGQNGDIFGNIVPDHSAIVWGVLYLCTNEGMHRLDHYEGVANGHYKRVDVDVTTDEGQVVQAKTYIACDDYVCFESAPTVKYFSHILSGAKYHKLPADYIDELERLASMK